jgi:hypothetical protein
MLAAGVAVIAGTSAAQQSPDLTPYLISDRAAEIALARSAAAKHVTDSATILVLTKSGYVEAVHGTNGFTCFVQHSFDGPINVPGFWNPKTRGPICLNAPAVRTVLPQMKKRAEWIMAAVSPSEIASRTKKAYASHEFPMPEAGAMSFMLSHEQVLSTEDTHWMPHLMFWYDRSIPAAMWGVGGDPNTIIDGSASDPDDPVLTLLIPVRRWSDGTLALPAAAK